MSEAAAHFLRDGYERTSIDRIAAGARVSKQAIYELCRDKEDLFEQVVRAEMGIGLAQDLREEGDLRSTLEAFTIDLIDKFATPRNYGLFRANIVATRQFPQLAAALHEYRRGASRGLVSCLERLEAQGVIGRISGSALDLSTRLGGMAVEGTRYFLGYDLPNRSQRWDQARLAVEFFLNGMGKACRADGVDSYPTCCAALPPWEGKAQLRLKPDRFAALCRAAADEFLAHGFEGASLDRIMAATGVGRSTIYRQFGNKNGLFRYVIGREVEALAALELDVPEGADLGARLKLLSRAALDLHLMPRSIAMHHLLVQESALFPEIARYFYDTQVNRLGRPFQRMMESEGLGAPAPAVMRVFHTLATFGVRYIASLRAVEAEERDAVSDQAAAIMMHGTIKRDSR